MATKAERFRYRAERTGSKKASAAKRPTVAAALAARAPTEPHNLSWLVRDRAKLSTTLADLSLSLIG